MPEALAKTEELAALERFVVENDDLLALEERIGRFNIFDALGIARAEIRHSNFLAWLLDPAESHGQGDLFLKALLMDIAKRAREQGLSPPFSPVHLDGADLSGVEVRREWKSIDLLLIGKAPMFAIAIENKLDSGEHSNQLQRYEDTAKVEFGDRPRMHVFLTPEGDDASDSDWVSYSYADIHRVISRIIKTNTGAIGTDVATFLKHYLNLLESRIMDDPQIDELCRRIYKNHRAAIDLIAERAGVGGNQALFRIEEWIKPDPHWHWVNTTTKWVVFMPKLLRESLPPIGTRPQFDRREWIVFSFYLDRQERLTFGVHVWPTTDEALRERIILRLVRDRDEFGLRLANRLARKGSTGKWLTLAKEPFASIDEEEEGSDGLENAVRTKLTDIWRRFATAHEAVKSAAGPAEE